MWLLSAVGLTLNTAAHTGVAGSIIGKLDILLVHIVPGPWPVLAMAACQDPHTLHLLLHYRPHLLIQQHQSCVMTYSLIQVHISYYLEVALRLMQQSLTHAPAW